METWQWGKEWADRVGAGTSHLHIGNAAALGNFQWGSSQADREPTENSTRLSPALLSTPVGLVTTFSALTTYGHVQGVGTSPQSQLPPTQPLYSHAPLSEKSGHSLPLTNRCVGSSSEGIGGGGSLQLARRSARASRASKSRRACWMPKNALSTLRRSHSFCVVKLHRLGFSACRVGST